MKPTHHEILAAAADILAPALRRGRRGVKCSPRLLGIPEEAATGALLNRALQDAARERDLALFTGPDGLVRVVSTAPSPEGADKAAAVVVAQRHRANTCCYCELQEGTPAALEKLPGGPQTGSVHGQCQRAWKAWSAAAARHAASLAPSPIPAAAGLVETVVNVAEELLGQRRGWRGRDSALWRPANAPAGSGLWAADAGLFVNLLFNDGTVRRALAAAGLEVWRGADGLARLVRNAPPGPHEGPRVLAMVDRDHRSCVCAHCGIDEYETGEPLERVPASRHGAYAHPRCQLTWLAWLRAASAHRQAAA